MGENNNESLASSWLALAVVIIGTFMSILDSSIVNIALPKMMAVFGVSLDDIKWVLTAYTLALGAIIPLTGYLQEILGAKRIYVFALAMFTVGSMLCGLSWSNTSMIAFRVLQAIGGGMIMPVGMSIIYQIFPREKIGLALGFWGIAAMAAPAIGPTLGGYIIEKMDWRLIFNVNVPVGIVGVILALILLKGTERKPFKSFDIIGFLSSTVGLVSILYVLGEGSSIDWSKLENPILMTLGCLSLVLFIVNELTHPDPLLDLRVFKLFDFTISQIITSVLTLAMMGGVYVLPLFLQNIRGYTPMEAGLIMLPGALVMGVMMPLSGNLLNKVGVKALVIPGLLILAGASYELATAINMNSSKDYIILVNCIRSIGIGLSMMPISTTGMNVVPAHLISRASALSNTLRQVAGSVSVTLMSTLIQGRNDYNYAKLSEQINVYNPASNSTISTLTKAFMGMGMDINTARASAVSYIVKIIQGQAYVDAMSYSVVVTVVIVFVTIFLALFMGGKKEPKKENKEGEKNESTGGALIAE
ncbi:DHA2 family efflux MFS transporter permease subunit [Clostridium beijerinckii]|uniref:DHA2 family efflux MFS transporter permease subunit n=1 Tax=Clostridium beijerinckii TaxID=1520 RepID=A0A1S8SEM3_CLOBE|nr:DHA2 family efflux MFS transporter permease subunit [Clostridium beijerinckii]NMF04168.1 DHA2 family efflux MFS transporter permease subunit [Clostridium beijerinckii]NRY59791.1 EmrB/QacA subfamily drug resistance transporter [Clostridium beijerinckii]OOM64003.1 multidrug export protein EmrB [Clostridium beijerinckii]